MDNLAQDLAALRIEREPERAAWARWLVWLLVLIVLAAAGVAARVWLTRERPLEVQVATVTERGAGTQAAVLNASGYVTARRQATVSSKITGKVIEVNIEEGCASRGRKCWRGSTTPTARAALEPRQAQVESARRGGGRERSPVDRSATTCAAGRSC